MQEQVSASLRSMSEIAAPGNTPSLDEVRDKIERRYANAMGSAELAQSSVQGRMLEVEQAGVQMAGHSRLEQIRASMRGEALPTGGTPAAPGATPAAPAEPPAGRSPRSRSVSSRRTIDDGGESDASAGRGARCCSAGLDTASELSDLVAQKISAASDPRARLLRRRRRALRWGLIFSAGCRVLGCGDGAAGGVGLVRVAAGDHRLDRGRAGDSGDVVAASLPLAALGAAAGAAARQRPSAAAARFGGATRDVRAGRLRTRVLLAAGRDGARQHVAGRRDP